MAKQMIGELRAGEPVDAIFLVSESALRTTRAGGTYLDIVLQDRTGQAPGRLWDATEAISGAIRPDDFVHVKGVAEMYKNEMQIKIKTITKADEKGLQLRDFVRQSEQDPKEMQRRLTEILAAVADPDYRALIDAFLGDEDFRNAFRTAPAAVTNHHAFLGGLLEHTLSMAELALKILDHYPRLRRDVLLTGILIHDIGKIRELSARRTFQYTPPGQLVGHIVLGVLMIEEKARALPQFPPEKLDLLRHMVLSHHGEIDFGAVKRPMFAEAVVLHHIDNIDAKVAGFYDFVKGDSSADPLFTNRSFMFQTPLYKG